MSILTISHKKGVNTLKALIVGGGISGLALAIMMDLANIEYEILEQYTGDEAGAGSALTLGPPVLRLLEQMGLLDQIEKVSIPVTGITVIDVECRRLGGFIGFGPERYGYPYRIMTRPAFYKILLDRVPKANLRRGKIVVDTLQNSNGVSCKCSDGSTYYGDIIVGADGAQSRTRERMYKQLAEQGKLPDADMEPSIYDHTSITGVSDVLDQTVYPLITDEKSDFQVIYNGTPRSFWYMPAPGNRIAWGLNGQLSTPKYGQSAFTDAHTAQRRDATLRRQLSHSSFSSQTPSLPQQNIYHDWLVPGPDFDDQFKDLLEARCAAGVGKVRDFLSHTPRESMSRVDLEERLYKTWYHSRIVLVGDACHPQLLVGGQGAIQGILDGVCLVNLLYDMEHNSPNEITKAFRKYHSKRSVIAKSSIDETNTIDKVFHDQGLVAGVMRRLIFNTAWNFNMGNDKFNSSRPQLSFLPFVEDRGSNKAKEQKISERLLRDSQP
ncbi:hypothetical protein BGZ58_008315 [Dissophora ornata]|nr:hypothetical protein BGZ58_008315 [Dissophora ornata]